MNGRIDRLPFRTRSPTDYEAMYAGSPPWEINEPQQVFERLCESGAVQGAVLDIGCGTGEHALMAAARGLRATGIDSSPTAIAIARRKADDRGLRARFECRDALDVAALGETYDTILDAGLFHVLDDDQRARYANVLREVVSTSGRVFIVCFSDEQPGTLGPRRVTERELRDAFVSGWRIQEITRTTMDSTDGRGAIAAWLGEFAPANERSED